MKKYIFGFVLFLLFPLMVFAQDDPKVITIYVRQGCAHCAKVEAFITKYALEDKVRIVETYNNEANVTELNSKYELFNIAEGDRGVPFMVINDTEYKMGDTPIIAYLTSTFNIVVESEPIALADVLFLVLGGSILFGVFGYGVYSIFKKK